MIQGTFGVIQGTFSVIRGTIGGSETCKEAKRKQHTPERNSSATPFSTREPVRITVISYE
jgi:hypothetical protein